MPPSDSEGPDGSSIKPVSSLRARFENMSKPASDTPTTLPAPAPFSGRAISPAPKPERLREPTTPTPARLSPAQTPKPKPRDPHLNNSPSIPASSSSTPGTLTGASLRPTPHRLGPLPPLSPRPIAPPSLLIQPPGSPPKGRANNIAPFIDQPSFLNPDGAVKSSSPTASPRFKVTSRPHTPSTDPGRSPRLLPSQPPSPPPPRRSAELKRERDLRDVGDLRDSRDVREARERRDVRDLRDGDFRERDSRDHHRSMPPPVKRSEKPKIPSQTFGHTAHAASISAEAISPFHPGGGVYGPAACAVDKRSPFSSPPSSSESLHEASPPALPSRLRPQRQNQPPQQQQQQQLQLQQLPRQAQQQLQLQQLPRQAQQQQADRIAMPPSKIETSQHTFEPPPVHPSIAGRRGERVREQDKRAFNGGVGGGLPKDHLTGAGDVRPPLPTRPRSVVDLSQVTRNSLAVLSLPPPKPPRPTAVAAPTPTSAVPPYRAEEASNNSALILAQKRVVSNPTTSATSTQHFLPPPSRTHHGRSMTVDRTNRRVTNDYRSSAAALAPATGPPMGGLAIPETSSRSGGASSGGGSGGSGGGGGSSGGGGSNSGSEIAGFTSSAAAKLSETVAPGFPDASNVNRRPPYGKQVAQEINTRYDCRVFDVCGELVCTTGHLTRVWSLLDGELVMSLAHGENVKATAVAFRPGVHVDDEAGRLWIGNSNGELMEADIATQSIVESKPTAHGRHEIVKIYRHYNEMWTLDDGGSLFVWGPTDDGGVPSLAGNQHQTYRVPRGHTFSMIVGDELWHAAGKELRVFMPTLDGKAQFQVLLRALYHENAGEISAGTVLLSDTDRVFFGHTDGKVSIYSRKDYSCLGLISLGSYKINTMAAVGDYVWAGFNTGRISVYDARNTPWAVKKDWAAHDSPVVKLLADRSSAFRTGQLQVLSLGADSMLRVWDGFLQDDWVEEDMQARDTTYCDFNTIRVHVMTWNAGASTPNSLRYSDSDAVFMQNLLQGSGSPDILVFGFQELVDLEDKTATAKRFLKPKKKEGSDQERMSHQYRDWRDFLVRCLDDYMAGELYHLLQTSHMVGLFTCIFVKADLRDRIRNVGGMEVKRGMGGLHGNKGAIVVRFLLDDSSLCFVNCHLAAGQSGAAHRHNDIAAILESNGLPVERDANVRMDSYVGGGDGSLILDHELCILNGDLNYRIDTMSRDTVVAAVKAGNLAKLLERDQLLVARRRNAAFRLRAFEELPITFAPTYKYDVGTDTYDSSEKKRSPAWCDRLLFRGGQAGRVKQLDYRRHEVRVSDHRPVTARFQLKVKRIDPKRRAAAWAECQRRVEDYKAKLAGQEKMFYLMQVIGYDAATSQTLIRERSF